MRKLNLAALSYERDGVLNALQRTGAVEIKEHASKEGLDTLPVDGEELSAYLSSLEAALGILSSHAESYAKEHKKEPPQRDGFSVSYEEFDSADKLKDSSDKLVEKINALADERTALAAEQTRLARAISAATPYKSAPLPFNAYADTLHTKIRLGTLPAAAWGNLQNALDGLSLSAYEYAEADDLILLTVAVHDSVNAEADALLSAAGFSPCPYSGDVTGGEQLNTLTAQYEAAKERQLEIEEEFYSLSHEIRNLKIYCDYIAFQLEKAEAAQKMRATSRTFFLEAFCPETEEEKVKSALDNSGFAVWYEFSDPAEDETVPTLLKNNAVVSNFEAITNMYSPPSHREFDPNTVMAFFYSLFLGFIMGDVGYGAIMLVGGGILWYKNKAGGLKNLSGVFAIGGIFALVWGFLFNSLFGIQILPYTVMPDAQRDMYTFVGIKIPSVLIIAMILGVIQLFAGYVCRAVQEWRRGNAIDGICDGIFWAIFSLGVGLAIAGLVEEFNLPSILVTIGGITAGVSLAFAAATAGRNEKLLGKFSKGFGSVYGVINYVSDILSYARLYGLMLSGAIIAQIVSQYSIQFMTSGSAAFVIMGAVLMVVGHGFNLAIGLLGAYIHDARLQYVEFYGRFFEGEGELFTPLGSQHKYIYIENKT